MAKSFDQWISQAVRQIRFRPDREAIEKELSDHMEDRKQDFLQELDEKAAEQAVLRAMGDAKETGKLLNKIHSPWLGYVWLASRVVLAILAVACGLMVIFGEDLWGERYDWYCEHGCSELPEETVFLDTGLSFREGGYRFRLDHGHVEQDVHWHRTIIAFDVTSLRPWQRFPAGLQNTIVTDSLGNTFTTATPVDQGPPLTFLNVNIIGWGPLPKWLCHLTVEWTPAVENGEFPQWYRLVVPDTDIDFTVYTTGEVWRN